MTNNKVYISEIIIIDEENTKVLLSDGSELVGLNRIACDVSLHEIPTFRIDGFIYNEGEEKNNGQ